MTDWPINVVQRDRELRLMRAAVRLDSKNSTHCILHFSRNLLFCFLTYSDSEPLRMFRCQGRAFRISGVQFKFRMGEQSLVITIKHCSAYVQKYSLRILTNVHRRQLTFILRKTNTWLSGNKPQNCTVTYLSSMNTRWYLNGRCNMYVNLSKISSY